jgi:hypothetical protein
MSAAKDARDVLEHFDEYARGTGRLERQAINELGIDVFEAAAMWHSATGMDRGAMFWGGGYDPID